MIPVGFGAAFIGALLRILSPRRWLPFLLVVVAVTLALACAAVRTSPERHSSANTGYGGSFASITDYRVTPQRTTRGGVRVDDPAIQLDDAMLDRKVSEVEACLAKLPDRWTEAQVDALHCLDFPVVKTVRRDWFDVKLAPDWYESTCTVEQLFPCRIDARLCAAKPEISGVTDPQCPCACRATIQGNYTIVTTPKANLLKAELVRLVTGCNYVWAAPLSACATP